MAKFKIGDEVRVKAGSPTWRPEPRMCSTHPKINSFGERLKVDGLYTEGGASVVGLYTGIGDAISPEFLEPWRDDERWIDGKWVPIVSWVATPEANTAKPAIVIERKGYYGEILERHGSTNEAFRRAAEFAEAEPGKEFVVYQEKGSRKVEKKSKAEELVESLMKHDSISHNADGKWTGRVPTAGDVVSITGPRSLAMPTIWPWGDQLIITRHGFIQSRLQSAKMLGENFHHIAWQVCGSMMQPLGHWAKTTEEFRK